VRAVAFEPVSPVVRGKNREFCSISSLKQGPQRACTRSLGENPMLNHELTLGRTTFLFFAETGPSPRRNSEASWQEQDNLLL
jgi:hypothetical protein